MCNNNYIVTYTLRTLLVMNISYFPNLHYRLPLLENLGTVKLCSCLKHCPRLFVLSFFMTVVAVFFFSVFCSVFMTDCCYLFCCFHSTKHFFQGFNTYGSSTYSTNIWHAGKTEVVTVPFEKKHPLNDFFNLLYLKL